MPDRDALLREARQYLAHGLVPRRVAYCPLCRRRARIAADTNRCSACVAAAIDRALGVPPAPVRPWARDHDRCRACGTTERPHHAHGYCTACLNGVEVARA